MSYGIFQTFCGYWADQTQGWGKEDFPCHMTEGSEKWLRAPEGAGSSWSLGSSYQLSTGISISTLLPLHQSQDLPSPVFFTASFYSPPTLLSYACPAIPGGHFPNPSLPNVALSSPLLLRPLGSLRIQPAVLGFFQKPGHYSQFPISPAASHWLS